MRFSQFRKGYIMTSFIIYERDKELRNLYIKVIRKFLYTSLDYYEIFEFDKITPKMKNKISKMKGIKIFIIDIDTPGPSALDFARKLREEGDFTSQIILLTRKDKNIVIDELYNILFLDFIHIDDELVTLLFRSLKDAYKIVTRHSVYTFSIFDEIYRISYNDIYFIKKNLNDDSVTIYTKDDTYLNYITVKGIESILSNDARFFKVHRSCIVNLYNVSSYDRKTNTIIFSNGLQTCSISKTFKAKLTQRLKDFKNDKFDEK